MFIAGDFCFGSKNQWRNILHRLTGKKYLILGNHDRPEDIPEECFEAIVDLAKIVIKIKDYGWQTFIVSHRPLLCWEGNLSGTIHAFGHCHSSNNSDVEPSFDTELLKFLPKNSWDVGVDNNDYRPISAEEIIERIKEKLTINEYESTH